MHLTVQNTKIQAEQEVKRETSVQLQMSRILTLIANVAVVQFWTFKNLQGHALKQEDWTRTAERRCVDPTDCCLTYLPEAAAQALGCRSMQGCEE